MIIKKTLLKSTINTIFSLLLFLFLFNPIHAQVQQRMDSNAVAKERVEKLERSLLWKISGKGLSAPSYLYGTIHLIDSNDFFLTDATSKALNESKKITFEIDLEKEMNPNNLSSMLSLLNDAFMKGDTSLSDLLSKEEYGLVKAKFEDVGLPIFLFERVKPLFLSTFIGGGMNPGDFQNGKMKSYEFELLKIAQEDKKAVGGLETAAYQMSVFDAIPYKLQAKMLVESLSEEDKSGDELKKMVELYKSQDIEGMQLLMKEDETTVTYENELLTKRNKNWIPVMEKMMKDGTTFFAVGAGHLAGANGVLLLLKKQGYRIEPLK